MYDRVKRYLMPAGDRKYNGLDQFTRRLISAMFWGSFTLAVWYPFELLLTRITSDMNGKGQQRLYFNTFDWFNTTMLNSNNGARVLYSGSLAALGMIAPMTILSIPIYDSLLPIFARMKESAEQNQNSNTLFLSKVGASTFAGMITMAIVYPLDTVKKWMQVIGTRGYGSVDRSYNTTIMSIYKAHGLRGFYR